MHLVVSRRGHKAGAHNKFRDRNRSKVEQIERRRDTMYVRPEEHDKDDASTAMSDGYLGGKE